MFVQLFFAKAYTVFYNSIKLQGLRNSGWAGKNMRKKWIQTMATVAVALTGFYLGVAQHINRTEAASAPAKYLTVSSNVNAYITSHNLSPVGITKDLHNFEIFDYSTPDKQPNGVVFHYTANEKTYSARSEADYEINVGWQNAFVHTFIDANTILNIHDIEKGCWGAGPYANHRFVQFELVTARNATEFAKSINNAAWYVANLADHFNWTLTLAAQHAGVGTLWTHYDVTHYLGGTDHVDPIAYLKKWGYNTTQFCDLANAYYKSRYPSPLNGARAYDKVTATTAVNLPGKMNEAGRSDGLYSAPYYTNKASIRQNKNAVARNGQVVQVLKKATTTRSATAGNTFYQIRFVNGATYWTDARAVAVGNFDPISAQQTVHYQARIKQAGRTDGLYPDGPFNTKLSNIYPNSNAHVFNDQVVPVSAEATTAVGTFCQIKLNSGAVEWMDKRGLTTDLYNHVVTTSSTTGVGRIHQANRHDGLYSAPFLTNAATLIKNHNAAGFNGQPVTILQSATTDGAANESEGNAFYQIRLNNGKTYWINQAGIQLVHVDHVTSTKNLNTVGTINEGQRRDGLYSAPWNTDALSITENHNAKAFNHQSVKILAEATTSRSSSAGNAFYQIQLKDGRKYWLDVRGVKVQRHEPIRDQKAVHYTAMIDQSKRKDGLYAHPYQSDPDSSTPNTDALAFAGRGVLVTALATVQQGTYAQVTLSNGQVKWIDVKALKPVTYNTITSTKTLNQTGVITQTKRQDGLYSAPWYTDAMSIQENHNAKIFAGQQITIIQQATTNRSAAAGNVFDQIKLANGKTYWIDVRGVSVAMSKYDTITTTKAVSTPAVINQTGRADGLYSAPYNTDAASAVENNLAKDFDGQAVTVLQQVTTSRNPSVGNSFAQIQLTNGKTYWIDSRGLQVK